MDFIKFIFICTFIHLFTSSFCDIINDQNSPDISENSFQTGDCNNRFFKRVVLYAILKSSLLIKENSINLSRSVYEMMVQTNRSLSADNGCNTIRDNIIRNLNEVGDDGYSGSINITNRYLSLETYVTNLPVLDDNNGICQNETAQNVINNLTSDLAETIRNSFSIIRYDFSKLREAIVKHPDNSEDCSIKSKITYLDTILLKLEVHVVTFNYFAELTAFVIESNIQRMLQNNVDQNSIYYIEFTINDALNGGLMPKIFNDQSQLKMFSIINTLTELPQSSSLFNDSSSEVEDLARRTAEAAMEKTEFAITAMNGMMSHAGHFLTSVATNAARKLAQRAIRAGISLLFPKPKSKGNEIEAGRVHKVLLLESSNTTTTCYNVIQQCKTDVGQDISKCILISSNVLADFRNTFVNVSNSIYSIIRLSDLPMPLRIPALISVVASISNDIVKFVNDNDLRFTILVDTIFNIAYTAEDVGLKIIQLDCLRTLLMEVGGIVFSLADSPLDSIINNSLVRSIMNSLKLFKENERGVSLVVSAITSLFTPEPANSSRKFAEIINPENKVINPDSAVKVMRQE